MAADDFVVLSVASEYKFRTLGEPTLADILARSAQPHLRYELVGPRSVPSVDDLPRSNVRAWGVQSDTSLFLAAADAFLDSWPFSSLTSALEAGVAGLPIITATWGRAGTVHALDSPGLDDGVVAIQTGAQLVDFLEVFAGDRVAKDVQGKVSSRIIELHSGDGWREVLKTVYAMAGSSASRGETGMQTKDRALGSTHADNVDIMTLNLRYAAGDLSDTSPEGAHGGLLSLRARLRQVWSERSLLTIVPQGTRTLASIALQAMKRRAQALSGSPTVSR
jgi:hypothetical protein